MRNPFLSQNQKHGASEARPTVKATEPESQPEPKPKRSTKPSTGGKGGKQHTSLQTDLKRYAESIGLGATIEKHIGGGSHIDLVLFKGSWHAAIEISISTSAKHECKNIEKCINAGYRNVFLVAKDTDTLEVKQAYISKHLSPNLLSLVAFPYS